MPGLAVTCDTTLAPVLTKVGSAYTARSGTRVFVFPTGPGLILPQLERDIQNDIIVTQVPILEQAAQQGIIKSADVTRWSNSLVIAGPRGSSATEGTFAACDPTPASDMDGPAVLAKIGLRPTRVFGAVDTDEVVFLLTSGAAQAGLLHMTDVRTDTRLDVIRPIPADIQAPIIYGACVTRLSSRPNPQGFVEFLATSDAMRLLTDGGLEART
jgi:molybdate transport system substrate-binding protein